MGGAIALAAVAAGAPPAAAQELTDARRIEVVRRLQQSTVVIQAGRGSGGSGFVVGDEGWIVTNAHVVRGSRRVLVRFGSGDRQRGRVVAYDPSHDLAVVRLEGDPPVDGLELGDSDAVEVGQTVLAFGSPFGLEGTLTQGIVSARRDLPAIGGGAVQGLIQTDAPINPGNSGGPLVDAKGRVVGVNTAILSRTGGSHGIGFAVPINYVKELLAKLRAGGGAGQPSDSDDEDRDLGPVWLGIYGDDFRARGVAGVRIQRVVPGGPAEQAGLLGAADPPPPFVRRLGIRWTGHIILGVDGKPVRSLRGLRRALGRHRPGDELTLFVTVGPGVVSGEVEVRLEAPPQDDPKR